MPAPRCGLAALALALVLVLTASCTASHKASHAAQTGSASPSPSASTEPTASPPAHPVDAAGVRICTARDLTVVFPGESGAMGQLYAAVGLRNDSASRCVIRGFPGISILDSHHRQIGRPAARDQGGSINYPGPPAPVLLMPRESAEVTVHFGSTERATAACGAGPTYVRVYPPGSRTALVALSRINACPTSDGMDISWLRPSTSTFLTECDAQDLTLARGGPVSAMTGEDALPIVMTNRSAQSCFLYGYPGVGMYAKGKPQPFTYVRGGQYVGKDAPFTVFLKPHESAQVLLASYRCDNGVAAESDETRIYPPGSTTPMDFPQGLPLCVNETNDANPSSEIEIGPVEYVIPI